MSREEDEEFGDEDESEEFDEEDDSLEKEFEDVVSSGKKVYFLEADGKWWSNTFKSDEIAKSVSESFKK